MRARGFTLFELLVVIAIIGLVLALVPGFLVRDTVPARIETAAAELAAGLRESRSEAVLTNHEQVFALDVDARRFRVSADRPLRQLDQTLELRFLAARSGVISPSAGTIRFYPDGSSTGGRIRLSGGSWRSDVVVDWLTGEIDVDDLQTNEDG